MVRTELQNDLTTLLRQQELTKSAAVLSRYSTAEVSTALEHLPAVDRAIAFRLLSKDRAMSVFEFFDAAIQSELCDYLADHEVTGLFDALPPDERVALMDEMPAKVTSRLMRTLSPTKREMTNQLLGYAPGSVGRRMSPAFVVAKVGETVQTVMARIRTLNITQHDVVVIPVIDAERRFIGSTSHYDLFMADPSYVISADSPELNFSFGAVAASSSVEMASVRCSDEQLLGLPVVDSEMRLVGVLTFEDAAQVLREETDQDVARAGGTEPLRRPYLSTSVSQIAKSRVPWLLVLSISGLLTVQVLEIFEDTLAQVVTLALFVPLLTGIGGNTGSQAATTITRALALGDVHGRDVGKIVWKECRTGLLMGAGLALLGFVGAGFTYDWDIALVIGITILSICVMAATVGGAMPLLAKLLRADPAVFSTPFISTFCDATGLIIYFSVARAVLGI